MLDLKLTLGCMIFISYTIVSIFTRNFMYGRMINMLKTEELKLVSEWDKTFPQSEKVDHQKVIFVNRYGITLAADLYKPKNTSGKYPAIAVSGPFGAVKEQCSGLYAQTMAEKGYLIIAFDPSFTGESVVEIQDIWLHRILTQKILWLL